MTDTRQAGTARADAIYAAMAWTGEPKSTVAAVIDHIPTDVLQRLHDERLMTRGDRCPRCDSPDPARHPAMQWEGEVQPCPHPWHGPRSPYLPPVGERS